VNRRQVAALGEILARRHLESIGYPIRTQNWRCPEGEIDLVAQTGETIVFVEVKARTGRRYGSPEESITPAKRRHLQRASLAYLEANSIPDALWRIDVIAVDLSPSGAVLRLEHYPNAVYGDEHGLR
jgi:putative endonuclease